MALAGTLSDFGLADIFQLIGLQKKTGVLTLKNTKEEVRILFMNGLVVGADTNYQKLENKLGRVLVKSNRITQEELESALSVQSKTLQRLGQVLIQKGFIKPEDLRESLQTQTTQIIYRLFRWTDGAYHFKPEKYVDYDQENFSPISSESILMEGVRMLDEWPMIEEVIPNFDILVERTRRGSDYKLHIDDDYSIQHDMAQSFDSILDGVIGDGPAPTPEPSPMEGINLHHEQELVLKLIDEPTVVQDLVDRSGLNEFETCRCLFDLIEMGLVRKVTSEDLENDVRVIEEERHIPVWVPGGLLVVLAVFCVLIGWNPANRYVPMPHRFESLPSQFNATNAYRVSVVADAVERFYYVNGSFPENLSRLVDDDFIEADHVVDSQGSPLLYRVFPDDNRFKVWAVPPPGVSGSERLLVEKVMPRLLDVRGS